MSSPFGKRFVITTFGESHGAMIGVVIDGCPSGLEISAEEIDTALAARRPSASIASTKRREPDKCEIVSGVYMGKTTGTPVTILIRNQDAHSDDYDELAELYRPGHADYTYDLKYGIRDHRGGGRASGRETAARVAAGAVAEKLLKPYGTSLIAHLSAMGAIESKTFDRLEIDNNPFFCADHAAACEMLSLAEQLAADGNSVGGVVSLEIINPPKALGEPIFDKLSARLMYAMGSIGAVKGLEIGEGFQAARLTGKENNDEMTAAGFLSNHAGGILGGISTGEPIVMRLAVKAVPSIALPQRTIDRNGKEHIISIKGRHDVCAAVRIVPVAKAMAWLTLADFLLLSETSRLS